jgi:hypothetical protein
MIANVGGFDKALRIVLGVVLIGLGLADIGTPWIFIGVVPLLTGLFSWCPLYPILGISSCRKKEQG